MLPAGKIAIGKLLQALVFGARVVAVSGNFDEALRVVRALSEQEEHPITLVNSVNPYRLEGQKTGAFEICDDLGRAPDVLAIPVGNAGNISAYWRASASTATAGLAASTPAMWGFQAAGAAPLVAGHPIEHPETIATAIRIGNPASWDARGRGARRLGRPDRRGHRRRDPRRVPGAGRLEGVFCEPSSAASPSPASRRPPRPARSIRDALVVCVLTGNGLKDPTTAERAGPSTCSRRSRRPSASRARSAGS